MSLTLPTRPNPPQTDDLCPFCDGEGWNSTWDDQHDPEELEAAEDVVLIDLTTGHWMRFCGPCDGSGRLPE